MNDIASNRRCAERLKAIADAERLQIIRALFERPQCVSDLAALLDNDIGNISHHLKVLRRQGVVAGKRQGKSVIYALCEEILAGSTKSATRGKRGLDFGCCSFQLDD